MATGNAKDSVVLVMDYIQNIRHQLIMLETELRILKKNGDAENVGQMEIYTKDTELGVTEVKPCG